jgi:ABC-type glycerol-3-phosphate transport system permease component
MSEIVNTEKKGILLMQKTPKDNKKGTALNTIKIIGIILVALGYLFPLFWLFDTSFRPKIEIFNVPPRILQASPLVTFKSYSLSNFTLAFQKYQVGGALLNSILVTVSAILLTLIVCSLAGYAFALLKFPGRNGIFIAILCTMMLPTITLLAPYFRVIRTLGLYNKHLGIIVPYAASAFGVFLLRQYYIRLPNSLLEAAVMDGASHLRIWWQIILPVSKPVLATLAIYQFTTIWNDFLVPLLILRTKTLHTLPIKLQAIDSVNVAKDYDAIIATSFIAIIIPIMVFLMFQRQFIEGISGSVKE